MKRKNCQNKESSAVAKVVICLTEHKYDTHVDPVRGDRKNEEETKEMAKSEVTRMNNLRISLMGHLESEIWTGITFS